MTNSREIQELQADLCSGRDSVLSAVEGVSEAEAHQIPEPGEWTVVQSLAHITELQSFWVTKPVLITQVTTLKSPGRPWRMMCGWRR